MRLLLTKFFDRDYKNLPRIIQEQCDKQLAILLKNPHHPSLRTSKIQSFKDIWEGRITKSIRFSFQILEGIYIIRRIGKHDEVLKKP